MSEGDIIPVEVCGETYDGRALRRACAAGKSETWEVEIISGMLDGATVEIDIQNEI